MYSADWQNLSSSFIFFKDFIYLFDRESVQEHEWGSGRQRENVGLHPGTLRSGLEPKAAT